MLLRRRSDEIEQGAKPEERQARAPKSPFREKAAPFVFRIPPGMRMDSHAIAVGTLAWPNLEWQAAVVRSGWPSSAHLRF